MNIPKPKYWIGYNVVFRKGEELFRMFKVSGAFFNPKDVFPEWEYYLSNKQVDSFVVKESDIISWSDR